jgi:hypothetical protein
VSALPPAEPGGPISRTAPPRGSEHVAQLQNACAVCGLTSFEAPIQLRELLGQALARGRGHPYRTRNHDLLRPLTRLARV